MSIVLQSWVPFALFATIGLIGYNICAKIGGSNLPPIMFASVMYAAGFIAMIPLFFWHMYGKPFGYIQDLPLVPVLFAVGAGLVVIIVDISIAAMFNRAAPMSLSMSAISAGCLALTTLIGLTVFKENMSMINATGILLALISLPLMFYSTK